MKQHYLSKEEKFLISKIGEEVKRGNTVYYIDGLSIGKDEWYLIDGKNADRMPIVLTSDELLKQVFKNFVQESHKGLSLGEITENFNKNFIQ